MGVLDLETQLTFYAAYHRHPTNVGIHMVFVPAIMFTSFLLGANVPPLFDAPFLPMPINLALVGAVAFASGYVLMEPVAGGLATPIILAFAFIGTALVNTYGVKANTVAIVVHVVSWLVQFAGHGIWEKKAPALLDNLVQALFLAPFFVFFEGLFACGYRPELRQRIAAKSAEKRRLLDGAKSANGGAPTNGTAKVNGKKEL